MTNTEIRPSHLLPEPVFLAILALEDATRAIPPLASDESNGLDHVLAVVDAGVARDRLAAVLFEHGVTPSKGARTVTGPVEGK